MEKEQHTDRQTLMDTGTPALTVAHPNAPSKVIINNLTIAGEETGDTLKDKIGEVLKVTSIEEECILGVKRLGKGNPPEYHAPVEVKLDPTVQIKELFKAKHKLKDTEHKTVYIEPYKSKDELKMEANFRRLVQGMPQYKFKGGRVISNN